MLKVCLVVVLLCVLSWLMNRLSRFLNGRVLLSMVVLFFSSLEFSRFFSECISWFL